MNSILKFLHQGMPSIRTVSLHTESENSLDISFQSWGNLMDEELALKYLVLYRRSRGAASADRRKRKDEYDEEVSQLLAVMMTLVMVVVMMMMLVVMMWTMTTTTVMTYMIVVDLINVMNHTLSLNMIYYDKYDKSINCIIVKVFTK